MGFARRLEVVFQVLFIPLQLLLCLLQLCFLRDELRFMLPPLNAHKAGVFGEFILAGGGDANAFILAGQPLLGIFQLGGVDALLGQLLAKGFFQLRALALVFGVGVAQLLLILAQLGIQAIHLALAVGLELQ